ncbi:hypothetical protein BC835DRAFT_1220418, partial [Cytidiella melzeri]
YRCLDCEDFHLSCRQCLLRTHQRLHTHLLQQYSDKTFRKVTLAEMGHIRYLGHHGEHCTGAVREETHAQILVVDSSGIAEHTFHFCTCRNAASQVQQLLEAKLFPASYEKIKTVFSFKVLDDYMLESTACKTSGNAFWSKLQRRTDNTFTSDVPLYSLLYSYDRYREFLRVSQCWRYLQIRKWFGVGYSNSSLKERELALFCAACPQPGYN